jgi:uncharacterized membrane protein YagU involved in acid resistance
VHPLLIGAVAGTVATIPMTVFMETMHRRLPGEPPRPLPPREVAEGLAVKAGARGDMSERQMQDLSLMLHAGYGAATGALFGLLAPKRPPTALAAGMLFGLGVWAASYLGWLPRLGVRQPIEYDPPARTQLMIASHLVWGASAGLIASAGRR